MLLTNGKLLSFNPVTHLDLNQVIRNLVVVAIWEQRQLRLSKRSSEFLVRLRRLYFGVPCLATICAGVRDPDIGFQQCAVGL